VIIAKRVGQRKRSIDRRLGGSNPAAGPIADLLRRTIEAGPASASLVPHSHESRETAYARPCESLIESLHSLDPQKASQIAEGVIRNGPGSLRAVCLKVWAGE
jgi:hypothetical protein